MRRLLLAIALASAAWTGESPKIRSADALDAEEQEERRIQSFMRDAAEFRLARAASVPDALQDALAAAGLAEAQDMLAHGGRAWYHLWMVARETRARWIAEETLEDHPTTTAAGEILHFILICRLEQQQVRGSLDALQRLWFYTPDHARLGEAMMAVLTMAEGLQQFEAKVDLEAEDPRQVVQIDGRGFVFDLDDVFRFLARHGDRETVAPRAALALARSLLLSGDNDDRWLARRAYEDFVERFPDSSLVFDAVLEQALSHLITYKGADYDVGALLDARDLVDVAELEVGGDPARAARVAAYRKRIGAWIQDRDLSVAQWYAARTRPWWLGWLKRPTELKNPDDGARYYARQVIARDRTAPQSGAAQELLDRLPPPPNLLGQ